ncbi:MAG: hypothetical protein L0H63_07980, partial [Nitrococcus sp.]|nr:hypothetical protein [Nitrococcus sp.]
NQTSLLAPCLTGCWAATRRRGWMSTGLSVDALLSCLWAGNGSAVRLRPAQYRRACNRYVEFLILGVGTGVDTLEVTSEPEDNVR